MGHGSPVVIRFRLAPQGICIFDVSCGGSSLHAFQPLASSPHWRYRMRGQALAQRSHPPSHNLRSYRPTTPARAWSDAQHSVSQMHTYLTHWQAPDPWPRLTPRLFTADESSLGNQRSAPRYCRYLRSSCSPRLDLHQNPLAKMHANTSENGALAPGQHLGVPRCCSSISEVHPFCLDCPLTGVHSEAVPPCFMSCLLYTSPSPRDGLLSRMPSSA